MASYLLKAETADMDRWRADARAAGVSFAEHIRRRLDAAPPAVDRVQAKAARGHGCLHGPGLTCPNCA